MVKRKLKQRFISLLCAAGLAATTCSPVIAASDTHTASFKAVALDTKEIAAIDFSTMTDLNSLNGWTIASGAGTATLESDPKQGKVLKMVHPSNGAETNLVYDSLNINEDTYRYVSVETVIKLGTEAHANQFSIPYLSDSAGKNAYTLLTEGDWSEYKCHVNDSSTKLSAGSTKLGQWQTICMDIDLKEDTFRVSVDGEYILAGANAREKVTNLNKIRYFADSWNTGTIYIKSAKVTAQKERTASTAFYVSANGNDANDGQSPEKAWATIKRVNREHFIPGDAIYFQRGGKWENQTLQPQGSGNETSKIILGSYGDENAPMPQIAANAKKKDALFLCNQQYWEIRELDISNTAEGFPMATNGITPTGNVTERTDAAGNMLGDYRGIHIAGRDVATLKGFWIHKVKVHDVTGHVTWIGNTGHSDPGIVNNGGLDGSKRTGGLLIECLSPTKGIPTQFSDIIIEESEFINNSFSGIAIKQWHGSGDQYKSGAWDARNGAGGAPDYYDANWKPHSNIIVQDNYVNQGASAYACNGIYLTSVRDSLVQRNVLEHIGTCGIELYFADNVVVQYNEVSDVAKKSYGADDNAIDPDWRVTNALIQYNYVHDCGEAFLLCGVAFNSGVIRYNLAQNCTRSYVHYSMGSGYFQIYNNVFYRSADAPDNATNNFDPWGGGSAAYFNNVFYDGKGAGFNFSGGTSFAYHNNAYFGTAAPSKETNPILLTEDPFEGKGPAIDRAGSFETGVLLEANGLRPKQAAPLIASGVNKDSNNISIEDGLKAKGTKFNFTPLAAMNANGSWNNCVNIERKDYPTFTGATGADAIFHKTPKTQTTADNNTPAIGMFEVPLDPSAIFLRGTVADKLSNALVNTEVRVTVNGKTLTTQTNEAGTYLITEGLTTGKATVMASGKTVEVTLTAGKLNIADITTEIADMPTAFEKAILNETFDTAPADSFAFDKGSTVENGQLVITKDMGNAQAAVASFSPQISSQKKIDFSFDWKCDSANKMGFEFRDSYDRLLFAVCAAPQKKELRTSTTGGAVDSAKAAEKEEPVWSAVTMDSAKTYTFHINADFTAKKVSFRLSEKGGAILAQKTNVSTDAINLAKMNACSWWDSKPQYIDNFKLTAPEEISLPLAGKTIYAFGDSIVAGHKYEKASFIDYAAGLEGMDVKKFAVNGATILDAGYIGGQILAQLEKASGNAPDYVIFNGGTNDAEYLKNNTDVKIGTVAETAGSTALDTGTFAGAFEQTIVKMKEKWPQAQIIYVAVHKLGSRDAAIQEQLHTVQMQACKKYGIAAANIYEDCTLDTTDVNQKNAYTFDANGDNGLPGINGSGTHPNLKAIEEFYVPVVTKALRNPQVPGITKPPVSEDPKDPQTPAPPTIKVTKVAITNGKSAKIAATKKISLKAFVEPQNATNRSLTWKSSNEKWATVNDKGVVTTKKAGKGKTVTITAFANDGSSQKASFKIKIMKNAVTKISFKAKKPKVKAGRKITLKTDIKTTGGKKGRKTTNMKLSWKSSNTKWATVNSKGTVTTKKAGKGKTVTITATATDGSNKKKSIKVKILK